MNTGLKDKVAIVGGSSRGLGKACAEALAREGAKVTICSRNMERLNETANELKNKYDVEILPVACDLSNYDDIKRLVNETISGFGRIDILVNNTGGPPPGGFLDHDDSNWEKAFQGLLMYVVRICREVIPYMKKQGWGRIINNTSFTVKEPADNLILSNVFRVGVISVAKTLSRQFAKDNITVNNVCPGRFDTERIHEILEQRSKSSGDSFEVEKNKIIENIPQGRMQKTQELADLVVFLASENASGITGTTIQVDGGMVKGLF
ncbi:SDR family oxidoreductase [Candidatus Poribacteria bacterium]|nr:SDR family oxidoreductase [Candidatus Poribacteria bacterium]